MQSMCSIGLDVHKRTISYYVKNAAGKMFAEGKFLATRLDLDRWMKTMPQPRSAVETEKDPLMPFHQIQASRCTYRRMQASDRYHAHG